MNSRHFAAIAAAAIAVGCGGSKTEKEQPPSRPPIGYSGSVQPASLGATSDKKSIASGAASFATFFGSSATGMMAFGAGSAPQRATLRNALLLAADARHQQGGAVATGAFGDGTPIACADAGTYAVTVHDGDGDPETTQQADYVQISFAGCNNGGQVSEGAFRMTILDTSGDDFVADAVSITTDQAFGLRLAFTDFASIDTDTGFWDGIDGDIDVQFLATVASGTLYYGISGTSIEGASGEGNTVLDAWRLAALPGASPARYRDHGVETWTGLGTQGAALAGAAWDLDARMCALEIQGCLNVETNPTFQITGDAQHPYTGAIKVSDDVGDFVKLTADDATYATISWSLDGQTGSQQYTWYCLEDETACY